MPNFTRVKIRINNNKKIEKKRNENPYIPCGKSTFSGNISNGDIIKSPDFSTYVTCQ